jgi:PKD repeat protein
MKKNIFSFIVLAFQAIIGFSQTNNYEHRCGTDLNLQRLIEADPSLLDKLNKEAKNSILLGQYKPKSQNDPYIIPVVFHVVHNGGNENISKAQILEQIATLNLDYMRLNADTTATRQIFKSRAGIPFVQFRLANLDPSGNCTDGIVRVRSILSENANDAVKAVSYWNSSKYLNIWVVKNIAVDQGQQGTTLGYAQFPNSGSAATDGVVVRGDYVGSTGTAAGNGNAGRTLTHEIGHILGLFHTFQGGCTPGFFSEDIDDTPPVNAANFGCNTNANSCTNDVPDLPDMIENYMDYSNGNCMNMFTNDQVTKMTGVLNVARQQLVSSANNIATGTADSIGSLCAPKAHFINNLNFVCAGTSVRFTDLSYNGVVENRQWAFDGGTPATSSDSVVNVSFATPGFYTISLTVSNSLGNNTKTISQLVKVVSDSAINSGSSVFEGFELADAQIPVVVENVENLGGTWQKSTNAFSGSKSFKITNYNNANPSGAIDNFTLLPIDMTQAGGNVLTFQVAYAQKPSTFSNPLSNEKLRVLVSTNCGQSWQPRLTKSGTTLSTAPQTSNGFSPTTPGQWRKEIVNLSAFASQKHLLVRFELTSSGGNNLYIDDINIGSAVGIEEFLDETELVISPNPANDMVKISLPLLKSARVSINILDVLGRGVVNVQHSELQAGQNSFEANLSNLTNGIYFIKLNLNNYSLSKKLIISK